MNKFIGIGRLTNNVELKETNNGKYYIKNSIAIKSDFKNSDGQYDTEFVNIMVWGKSAEILAKYSFKGMLIAIEGRLVNLTYDKNDGTKGYITEIICEKVKLLESNRKVKDDDFMLYSDLQNKADEEDNYLE